MDSRLTASQLSCFRTCQRRHWFQYVEGIVPEGALALMPAAGEGPFVEHQDYAAKRVQKTEVTRAPVSIKQVAVGEMNGIAKQTNDVNSPSRAEVRQETRDAIAAGHGPATGAL